jgi:hypothetical protein
MGTAIATEARRPARRFAAEKVNLLGSGKFVIFTRIFPIRESKETLFLHAGFPI